MNDHLYLFCLQSEQPFGLDHFEPVGEQYAITLEDGVLMECLAMSKPIGTPVAAPTS